MFKRYARAVRRIPGQMNKLEAEYAKTLEDRLRSDEIIWYKFESVKLKLANNTFYTPDFIVMTHDGTLEVHETKGFWEDDARVKIKVAAETFPFKFKAITKRAKKNGGGWDVEEF